MRKPTEALPDFHKAQQLDASLAHVAQQRIGAAFRMLKRPKDAKAAFAASLTALPDCPTCWSELVKICAELVSREQVISCVEQVRIPDGYKPSVVASRAQAFMEMGFFDEALEELEKATTADANLFPSFGNSYGLLLARRGRYLEAIAVYERLLQETDSTYVRYNLAVATARHKGIDKAQSEIAAAKALLNKALSLKTNDGSALYGLAGLNALHGNKEEALHLVEEAVKHNNGVRNWLKFDAAWKDIQQEPRLKTLLQTENQISD